MIWFFFEQPSNWYIVWLEQATQNIFAIGRKGRCFSSVPKNAFTTFCLWIIRFNLYSWIMIDVYLAPFEFNLQPSFCWHLFSKLNHWGYSSNYVTPELQEDTGWTLGMERNLTGKMESHMWGVLEKRRHHRKRPLILVWWCHLSSGIMKCHQNLMGSKFRMFFVILRR